MSDNNQNPIPSAPGLNASAGDTDAVAGQTQEQQARSADAVDTAGAAPSTGKSGSGGRKSSSSEVRR